MSDNLEKLKGVNDPLLKELKHNQTNNGSDTYSGSYALGVYNLFRIYFDILNVFINYRK